MIRYGTNPIAWANDDDPTIGAHISTDQILHEAGRLIGFDGMENGHRWPEDPVELKETLGRHGLVYVSGWYSAELLKRSVEEEIEAVQGDLAKLRHNGCSVCIVAECSNTIHGDPSVPVSQKPSLSADEMKAYGAKLEAFSQYLADQGFTAVYHPHMGTIIQTPDDIDGLMAATGPATKLLFDTGHCYFGGGDPLALLTKHASRVKHFHAKNVRQSVVDKVRSENLSFLEAVKEGVFTVPGDQDGAIDFEPLLKVLADQDYDGWLVIEAEQDSTVRNPLLYQTLGLHTLKRIARETGLDTAA